jgi:hypothetical protein
VLVYRAVNEPDVYYVAGVFESRASYEANSADPAQHTRFMELQSILAAEPEWHDGDVIFAAGRIV